MSARDERIVTMYRQGLTLQKIGTEFAVTRERVRQIVKKSGAVRAGPEFRRAIRVEKERRAALLKAAQFFDRYGVSIELHDELRANGLKKAFGSQRKAADARGIGWHLTLGEWFAIWQASGKLHLRGVGKDRYCMSRIKDDGPYALGNVHIQTNVENAREGFAARRGKFKEHTGIFCLYPGAKKPWLAKVDGVRLGFFETIEEAVAARAEHIATHGRTDSCIARLGAGRGWTFVAHLKARPYYMQGPGAKGYFATQEEAEAAYRAAVAARLAEREAA